MCHFGGPVKGIMQAVEGFDDRFREFLRRSLGGGGGVGAGRRGGGGGGEQLSISYRKRVLIMTRIP
jgi:hypothetical protein